MDREQEERLIRLICVCGERRHVGTKGQRSRALCMYTHVCSQARYKKHVFHIHERSPLRPVDSPV